jgi:hypothetical protein
MDTGSRLNHRTQQITQDYCCYFLNGRGQILFPADIGAESLDLGSGCHGVPIVGRAKVRRTQLPLPLREEVRGRGLTVPLPPTLSRKGKGSCAPALQRVAIVTLTDVGMKSGDIPTPLSFLPGRPGHRLREAG